MQVIIRSIREPDRTQWAPLWAGYLAFYKSELASEITETTFARFLDPAEPMQALVAEDTRTGALHGFAHCIFHRGSWSIGEVCYLEDLFIAESARGRGAGRALMQAVYALADTRGCSRVYWLTHESNATARRLYDKIAEYRGFIQYRRP